MPKGLPYNGWIEEVRHSRDYYYYDARTRGALPHTATCHACDCSFGDNPVPYHAEDYGPSLEDYWKSCVALCHRCHAMVHARFSTPNMWRLFLTQLSSKSLDEALFPQSSQVAALLSKFKNRSDIEPIDMPAEYNEYLGSLPMTQYNGAIKVATLLVLDQNTQEITEVPDWTIYGEGLENLSDEGRAILTTRGLSIEDFLSDKILVTRKSSGDRQYKKLYLNNKKG